VVEKPEVWRRPSGMAKDGIASEEEDSEAKPCHRVTHIDALHVHTFVVTRRKVVD